MQMYPGSLRLLAQFLHRSRCLLASVSYQQSVQIAIASNPRAQKAKKRPVLVKIFIAAIFPRSVGEAKQTREGSWVAVEAPHDGTHSLTYFGETGHILDGRFVRTQRCQMPYLNTADEQTTICYDTEGERREEMGWMTSNAVTKRQPCSCASSSQGARIRSYYYTVQNSEESGRKILKR